MVELVAQHADHGRGFVSQTEGAVEGWVERGPLYRRVGCRVLTEDPVVTDPTLITPFRLPENKTHVGQHVLHPGWVFLGDHGNVGDKR